MKKFVALIILMIIFQNNIYAEKFPENDSFENSEIFSGINLEDFNLNKNVLRAEFVAVLNNIYQLENNAELKFVDVMPGNWFYEDIQTAVGEGYAKGYSDVIFLPLNAITREEALVMIANNLELPVGGKSDTRFLDDDEISDWSRNEITALVNEGYFDSYNEKNLRPKDFLKWKEGIEIAEKLSGNEKLSYDEEDVPLGNIEKAEESFENQKYSFYDDYYRKETQKDSQIADEDSDEFEDDFDTDFDNDFEDNNIDIISVDEKNSIDDGFEDEIIQPSYFPSAPPEEIPESEKMPFPTVSPETTNKIDTTVRPRPSFTPSQKDPDTESNEDADSDNPEYEAWSFRNELKGYKYGAIVTNLGKIWQQSKNDTLWYGEPGEEESWLEIGIIENYEPEKWDYTRQSVRGYLPNTKVKLNGKIYNQAYNSRIYWGVPGVDKIWELIE